MSAELRSCWRIRPLLSMPRVSVRAEAFDRSAEISVVIPDVTGSAPFRCIVGVFAQLWNSFAHIEKERVLT